MNCVFFLLFIVSFMSFLILSYLILSSVSISVSFVWFTVSVLVFLFLFLWYFGGIPGKLLQLCDLGYRSVTVMCICSSINIINLLTFSRENDNCQTLSIPSATVLVCVFRCTSTWRVWVHCDSQVWPCLTWTKKYIPKHPDESLMAFRCFASSESGSSSSPANRPRATISMRMFPSSNNLSARYMHLYAPSVIVHVCSITWSRHAWGDLHLKPCVRRTDRFCHIFLSNDGWILIQWF